MKEFSIILFIAVLCGTFNVGALEVPHSALCLSPIFSSGMVIQRDRPVAIRGRSTPGSMIALTYKNQAHVAETDSNGQWHVILSPMAACSIGSSMTIASPDSVICLDDIVVGDVWICSGQSNMTFSVSECVEYEVKTQMDYVGTKPDIRLYDMRPRYYTNNEEWDSTARALVNKLDYFYPVHWVKADSVSVSNFSAIGFSFAHNLSDSLNVPIGLISNSVGGSPIESWIDFSILQSEFPDILSDFANNDMIHEWVRGRVMVNLAGESPSICRHPYQPAYLYESAVKPLADFAVKGVLWYQGESNAHNPDVYSRLFPLMVKSWRKELGDGLPIYFAQLSSMERPAWSAFRASQRHLTDMVRGTAMVVTHDLGDSLNVHPRRKMEIGRRFALVALYDCYDRDLECSGPIPLNAVADSDGLMTVEFSHAVGLHSSDGGELRTFELAAIDGQFFPAVARIPQDGVVELKSDRVSRPCYLRYAWQPYTCANLVNAAGLPVATFVMTVK